MNTTLVTPTLIEAAARRISKQLNRLPISEETQIAFYALSYLVDNFTDLIDETHKLNSHTGEQHT